MRDLLDHEKKDVRAAEAVALFCHQAKKWIGSFAAALGGLDTLVFAGGIGENAPVVRARICEGLKFLGVKLDKARNKRNAVIISTNAGRVKVRVIRTDEELMIARSVSRKIPCPPLTFNQAPFAIEQSPLTVEQGALTPRQSPTTAGRVLLWRRFFQSAGGWNFPVPG